MDNEQTLPDAEISLFACQDENEVAQVAIVIRNAEVMNVDEDADGNVILNGPMTGTCSLEPVIRLSYDEGCKFIVALSQKLKEAKEQYGA